MTNNAFYNRMHATALKMLEKFGSTATLGYAAATLRTADAVRIKTIARDFPDSRVQVGDIQYLVAPATSTGAATDPKEDERFATDETGIIKFVDPLKPADIVLAYYVYVRNG